MFINLANLFFDAEGSFQWASIAAGVSLIAAGISIWGTFRNNKIQKEINQQNIDANLKAKARIEWIEQVREKTSDLLVSYFELETLFDSKPEYRKKWSEVSKNSTILKLFFTYDLKSSVHVVKTDRQSVNGEIFDLEKEKSNEETFGNLLVLNSNENKNLLIRNYIDILQTIYEPNNFYKLRKEYKEMKRNLEEYEEQNSKYIVEEFTDLFDELGNFMERQYEGTTFSNDEVEETVQSCNKKLRNAVLNELYFSDNMYFLEQTISIYLKTEWDIAKTGK